MTNLSTVSLALASVFLVSSLQAADTMEDIPVPTTVDEAIVALDLVLSDEDKAAIRANKEDEMYQYHFGLGMWIRNSWGLWRHSELANFLYEKGLHHPDDMSSVILDSYWRHLNDRPIDLDAQIIAIREVYGETISNDDDA
ncbi:MAG: DUF6794 domain-containing protein [Pseudomonadota bacterium]